MKKEQLEQIRHTLAHALASAVLKLYPNTKHAIGPVIDNGFYYDFDFEIPVTEDDLKAIEIEMKKTLKTWKGVTGKEVSDSEARAFFADNPYKLELIDGIAKKGDKITFYTSGDYTDLCAGNHIDNPSAIPCDSFKLDKIAGAYWRGDEKNKMLTRIYGLAFESKDELDLFIKNREEAAKRDHRKLGKELSIFAYDDEVGAGLPLWLPNGGAMIEALEKLAKDMEFRGGYKRVKTPHLAKDNLYLTSGHLPYYEDSMYPPMEYEGGKYYLKAMNCPHHHKIYAAEKKSYKDLPLRLAEYGTCYRHEKSGELFGLMRVRSMQMNDAHIYCTEEQFFNEFKAVIELYLKYFKIFGIDKYMMRLSKHSKEKLGQKYINEPELWIKTEDMVRKCLVDLNVPFFEAEDEAAFYGPKIDVQVWSVIGKEFTLATNQVDFAVPARFGLTYMDKDGKEKTPLCIHRAPLSTHERLIGFLIEHYGGNFPLWLSPVQIKVIPIGEAHVEVAQKFAMSLINKGIRADIDSNNDSFGKKVRSAKTERVPYFAIIGDKDIEAGTITLESRDAGKIGSLKESEIIDKLIKENEEYK